MSCEFLQKAHQEALKIGQSLVKHGGRALSAAIDWLSTPAEPQESPDQRRKRLKAREIDLKRGAIRRQQQLLKLRSDALVRIERRSRSQRWRKLGDFAEKLLVRAVKSSLTHVAFHIGGHLVTPGPGGFAGTALAHGIEKTNFCYYFLAAGSTRLRYLGTLTDTYNDMGTMDVTSYAGSDLDGTLGTLDEQLAILQENNEALAALAQNHKELLTQQDATLFEPHFGDSDTHNPADSTVKETSNQRFWTPLVGPNEQPLTCDAAGHYFDPATGQEIPYSQTHYPKPSSGS
ncbi:hypothetical protein EDB81DRAFT_750787 [Dactylonectria macrodidyma]|uniref:Uncharacterized protein n=1 Tax=Dactylonectria macrodidyma TaxID=307937 RepID=A0A9P9JHS6_9HYPO|nr:hypothetical protein EDB81DRAFT_750787 [Dactylonectria macrodidyma]